ncbi:MAG: MFS transporter [Anaerolineales bacterium]|nr:MFS transporter [Anaerolineales bacterium]MCX7609784.1 MFS transporter [Anaerolineales bacterium]MDW8226899.1 MFS transporter [Anaerolineales bacterium]
MPTKQSLMTSTLTILLLSMILANIGGNMYGQLLPLYVRELGADLIQVGIFFTLAMVAPLLFQILGGWLSDSIGRVQAMAIGSLAGLTGYLVFVVAPSWSWLLLAIMGLSMASSFVGPSFQALVAEQSREETRGRVFSITQGVFMIVGVVGAPLGGFLADRLGFRWMFAVAAALYALATVIRVFMARRIRRQEEAAQKTPRPAPSFANLKTSLKTLIALIIGGGIITWIFLCDGVSDVTFSLVGNLFPIYMNDIIGISKTELGVLNGMASVVTMALIVVGGWISDKAGERVGIVAGNLLIAGALFTMLNVRSFAGLIPAWILLGMGQALAGPAYNALISKAVPNHLRGTAFGFFSTSLGVISLPAPYIGTWMWQHFGPRVPFYVPLVTMLAMLPVIWFKFKLPKSDKNAQPALPDHDTLEKAPKAV